MHCHLRRQGRGKESFGVAANPDASVRRFHEVAGLEAPAGELVAVVHEAQPVRSDMCQAFEKGTGPDAAVAIFRHATGVVVVEGTDYLCLCQGAVQYVDSVAGGNPYFARMMHDSVPASLYEGKGYKFSAFQVEGINVAIIN